MVFLGAECVSSLSTIFSDERSIRDLIYAELLLVPALQKIKERETVKGKSDLELITNQTCMVIEFKRTYPERGPQASLKKAIEQIKKNPYGLLFSQSHILYPVAIVISSEEKKILPEHRKEIHASFEVVRQMGYSPCGICLKNGGK